MKQNFRIFSWHRSFLDELKNFVNETSDGCPGNAIIITPNRRPARYITDLYRKDRTATLLPKMITITDMVAIWRSALTETPLRMANRLDQVAILHECVREIAEEDAFLAQNFRHLANVEDFFPWGLRLAAILEDFAIEGRELADMKNLEAEVGDSAAALLGCLRKTGDAWRRKLAGRNWTTPGLDHYVAAKNAASIPPMLNPADRPVIIAGFYILSGTHDVLLRSLWDAGAHVCLHTDPALAGQESVHPASEEHARWLKRWRAEPILAGAPDKKAAKPAYSFFAGHDLHSQLEEMNVILSEPGKEKMATAVIPCKNETLMATLQNMPERRINISMGYPMARSPLARLVSDILGMVENARGFNLWQSADVLKVIRHPYINMLRFASASGEPVYLASSLDSLDAAIRKSGSWWDSSASILDATPGKMAFDYIAGLFSGVQTPASLAAALEELCLWLAEYGKDTWPARFPLDVEVMHRLTHEIIPVLRNNMLADSRFALPKLRQMLMQLVESERIPFEADPMHGLQILGMLESRLLQFDRVVILDATDDLLPGNPPQDPLLPENLRFLLRLPESRRREATAFHNLTRLCMGAKEVHFLWQEGVARSDFYDSKKVRSRFVEKLVWEEEQNDPGLLQNRNGPVRRPASSLAIFQPRARILRKSSELEAGIDKFWSGPVPVTSLDAYLRCPLQFIWQYVMNLDSNDKGEKAAPLLAGSIVHKIIEKLYLSIGHELPGKNDGITPLQVDKDKISEDLFAQKAKEAFEQVAARTKLKNHIPLDSYLTLAITIPARLLEFWRNQPESVCILGQEVELDSKVEINGAPVLFTGRADRLDLRDGLLYVMDYKTGREIPANDQELWEDRDFFKSIGHACANASAGDLDQCYEKLGECTNSLQLVAYLMLLQKSSWSKNYGLPGNAAWIPLRYSGAETYLVGSPLVKDDIRLDYCRQCVELINSHMRNAPQFMPVESEKCQRCGYKNLCWQ